MLLIPVSTYFYTCSYYLSPELCSDKPYRDKSDVWALGVLAYETTTFKHPFEATNQYALIMKVLQSPVILPNSQYYSDELIRLILWLLQKDPNNRPTIKEVLCEEFIQYQLNINNIPLPSDLDDLPTTDILKSSVTRKISSQHTKSSNSSNSSNTTVINNNVTASNRLNPNIKSNSPKLSGTQRLNDSGSIKKTSIRGDRVRGPAGQRIVSKKVCSDSPSMI